MTRTTIKIILLPLSFHAKELFAMMETNAS